MVFTAVGVHISEEKMSLAMCRNGESELICQVAWNGNNFTEKFRELTVEAENLTDYKVRKVVMTISHPGLHVNNAAAMAASLKIAILYVLKLETASKFVEILAPYGAEEYSEDIGAHGAAFAAAKAKYDRIGSGDKTTGVRKQFAMTRFVKEKDLAKMSDALVMNQPGVVTMFRLDGEVPEPEIPDPEEGGGDGGDGGGFPMFRLDGEVPPPPEPEFPGDGGGDGGGDDGGDGGGFGMFRLDAAVMTFAMFKLDGEVPPPPEGGEGGDGGDGGGDGGDGGGFGMFRLDGEVTEPEIDFGMFRLDGEVPPPPEGGEGGGEGGEGGDGGDGGGFPMFRLDGEVEAPMIEMEFS